jgi:hypothetical protein
MSSAVKTARSKGKAKAAAKTDGQASKTVWTLKKWKELTDGAFINAESGGTLKASGADIRWASDDTRDAVYDPQSRLAAKSSSALSEALKAHWDEMPADVKKHSVDDLVKNAWSRSNQPKEYQEMVTRLDEAKQSARQSRSQKPKPLNESLVDAALEALKGLKSTKPAAKKTSSRSKSRSPKGERSPSKKPAKAAAKASGKKKSRSPSTKKAAVKASGKKSAKSKKTKEEVKDADTKEDEKPAPPAKQASPVKQTSSKKTETKKSIIVDGESDEDEPKRKSSGSGITVVGKGEKHGSPKEKVSQATDVPAMANGKDAKMSTADVRRARSKRLGGRSPVAQEDV